MIYPRLLSLSSNDLAAGVLPLNPEHCYELLTATIGPAGEKAGDNFSFHVATPSALADSGVFGWGRGILIVESFSWEMVARSLNLLLAHAARETWLEVAQVLNKDLLWEFDGYKPA